MNVIKCLKCFKWRVRSYDDLIYRRISMTGVLWSPAGMSKYQKPKIESPKEEPIHFEPFYDMIIRRRDEALKSILINLDNVGAVEEIFPYLQSLEGVKSTSFYTTDGVKKKYVLVEFSTVNEVNNVLAGSNPDVNSLLPAEGRVFNLQCKGSKRTDKNSSSIEWRSLQPGPIFQVDGTKKFSKLDDVMDAYLSTAEVCDLSTRLHFLTCVQVERVFLGAFPKVRAIPFGSSVNGFGRKGGDIDISLLFNHRLTFSRSKIDQEKERLIVRPPSHEKTFGEAVQVFGNMLRVMLPSCSNVISVPHARIPIVKFRDCDTGLDCDLNVSGPLGICMSEMLYSLSCWDKRCRSLLFTIRAWARHHGITTSTSPTTKITNFSLLLLVIYFLQRKHVIPTLEDMEQLADDRDVVVYQGEPHLFLRHVTVKKMQQWRRNKNNLDRLSQLLSDFFMFYAKFPFDSKAISITKGKTVNSPTRDAMYIVNPLEETLNVARNVRPQNVELFQYKCKLAHESLQITQWQEPLLVWYSLFEMENTLSRRNASSNLIQEIFKDPNKRKKKKRKRMQKSLQHYFKTKH